MRAATLLLLACLLAAGIEAGTARGEPPSGAAPAEAAPAQPAPEPGAAQADDPYRQRMTRGHRVQPPRHRSAMTRERVGQLKMATALAGAALLLWGALASREHESPGRRRMRDAALLALAATAAFAWTNFSAFHRPAFGHASDTYHRYVGAKYFRELGYERLYLCAAVADVAAGRREQVERRYPRSGAGGERSAVEAAIAQPTACTAHFEPERWDAFQRDIAWFREGESVRRWQEIQAEPGYRESPVWTGLGGSLANALPATDDGILALRLLDPLLLAAMWGGAALAFGWRAACVALLFWGTNSAAGFEATGGSFLRHGWLAAAVGAVCALRGGRPALAGVLLAAASALESAASFVLAALALRALLALRAPPGGRGAPESRRLLAAALAAGSVIFAFSLVAGGGLPAWREWRALQAASGAAPRANEIGLANLVAGYAAAPAEAAQASREADADTAPAPSAAPAAGRWLFLALLAGYLALLARAVANAPASTAAVLGLGGMLVAASVPAPASAGLLAFGLIWPRRPAIGIGLCLLAFAIGLIANAAPPSPAVFARIGLASVAFVAAATAAWPRPQAAAEDGAGDPLRPA